MTRRSFFFGPLLGVALVLCACEGTQEIELQLTNTRDNTKAQMDLLKKNHELVNRKLNDLNERIVKLQETNDRLSGDLTTFASRPEEVKLEIIQEVNTRFDGVAREQAEFKQAVEDTLQARMQRIDAALATQVADMEKTLQQHSSFVMFVATEQDSINRVFANRFDSRPWYQSYMGKWEDMQKSQGKTQ
jgi:archaellum component FlaC